MPRPKVANPRAHYVQFRLTTAELIALQGRAARSGSTLSDYGRAKLLRASGRGLKAANRAEVTPEVSAAVRALAEQLRRVGVNLNQIARRMNEMGEPPSRDLSQTLADIRGLVAKASDVSDLAP